MRLLKIENQKALFLGDSDKYSSIEKITKEHILRLVDLTLREEITLDEYDEAKLPNIAHQIVYKSIYEKLKSLADRRDEFLDASERLFLTEYEKYGQDAKTV